MIVELLTKQIIRSKDGRGEVRYAAGVCNVDDELGQKWIDTGVALDAQPVAEEAPKDIQTKRKNRKRTVK